MFKHTVQCAELQSLYYKIEYVNSNTNQPNNHSLCLFSFFVLFLFSFFPSLCHIIFSFVSFSLSLFRCHCFHSFSLLQFNFKAKSCYRRAQYLQIHKLHITCTILHRQFNGKMIIFFVCTSAINAIAAVFIAVIVAIFSGLHSFEL